MKFWSRLLDFICGKPITHEGYTDPANIIVHRTSSKRIWMHGFGHGVKWRDTIILNIPDRGPTKFRVEHVEYCKDPKDMWYGILKLEKES